MEFVEALQEFLFHQGFQKIKYDSKILWGKDTGDKLSLLEVVPPLLPGQPRIGLKQREEEMLDIKRQIMLKYQKKVEHLLLILNKGEPDFEERKEAEKYPDIWFFDIYDAKSICDSLVEGGRKGISVQSAFSSEEEVQVKAIYTLKLSVPFFRPIRFQKDTAVKRRVFSGYVKHRRDYDAAGDNSIVYVAENGVVYHKNASCSHICLKITGNAAIQDIVHSSKYAACEKCIHKGSSLSAIFVTAYGDCYHSTLGCSGLKRTIKAVRLKDVGRLRPCSRCASGR